MIKLATLALVTLAACGGGDDESIGWQNANGSGSASSDGPPTVDVAPGGNGTFEFQLVATGGDVGTYALTTSTDGSDVLASTAASPTSIALSDGVAANIQLQYSAGSNTGTGLAYLTAANANDLSSSVTATLIVVVQ